MRRFFDIGAKVLPFLLIVTAMAVAGVWNVDKVRLFAVEQLADRDLQRIEAAVNDPSDEVASAACYHTVIQGANDGSAALMNALQARPKVAFSCIERVAAAKGQSSTPLEAGTEDAPDVEADEDADDDSEDAGGGVEEQRRYNPFVESNELVPRHELIAAKLGKRWMGELIDGSAASCQMAKNARRAMHHARMDATYRLLSCAVAADSDNVRECCVEELGGQEAFAELLDQPGDVPLYQAADDFTALVGASFASVPIAAKRVAKEGDDAGDSQEDDEQADDQQADDEQADDDRPEADQERFGAMQADVQDWVVEVGCRLHFDAPGARRTVEAFAPLIESDGCAPTDPPWAGYYSEQSWSSMCTGSYEERRSQRDEPPREAICSSLEAASVEQVVATTRMVSDAALSVARQADGVHSELHGIGSADAATFRRPRPNAHRRNTGAFDSMLRGIMGF